MSDEFRMSDLLRDPVQKSDDAILADILRRLLAQNDLMLIGENLLGFYGEWADLSDTEADAIRRVLDQ